MDYSLTAEHIQKKYGGTTILNNVSMRVKKGEIYGLVGKNGSGKTTLLRILTGLIQDYKGSVNTGKNKVAVVINDPSLFLNMTALENLNEQARLMNIRDSRKINSALKLVGLDNCNEKLVKNFSLGMTQRLKLAMALLEVPDVLILDEPVNGLDPDGIADLRELLLKLNRENGVTILISSHILSELEQIATCFGILHDGEIVKEFYIKDVLQTGKGVEEVYMQHTRGGIQS